MADSQNRKWQLTINNPIDKGWSHDLIILTLQKIKDLDYWCLCDEIGLEKSTLHTHIFFYRFNPIRFSRVKKLFPEAHIEAAKGSCQENRDYIRKEGKYLNSNKSESNLIETFEEDGVLPDDSNQGKRNDLDSLYQMLKDGYTDAEILEDNPNMMRYIEKMDKVREMLRFETFKNKRRLDLKVEFWYGPAGCGKTSGVMNLFGDDKVYRVTDYRHPFDDYHGEDIVLFDDFDSSRISVNDLLKWLDIYPLILPCRFSNKVACYTKVYFTSNYSPSELWQDDYRWQKETYNALMRRIHVIKKFDASGLSVDVKEGAPDPSGFVALSPEEDKQISLMFGLE